MIVKSLPWLVNLQKSLSIRATQSIEFNFTPIFFFTNGFHRSISFNVGMRQNVQEKAKETWSEIYRLPLIRWAAAFNRLKNYQYGLTLFGTPVTFALQSAALIPEQSFQIFGSIGVTGAIVLTLGSLSLQNLIGFIYINRKIDKVRIGYVDFWGRRQNAEFMIKSISPSYQLNKFQIFQTLKVNETNSAKLKLLHRYCQISDNEIFSFIFGEKS